MHRKKTVVFIHPDLGIGGAERLIVDAAIGLQQQQYDVYMYTQHHDLSHCFRETMPLEMGGSLRNGVRVYGDWLPRHLPLFHAFHILFAMIRMVYCALCVALWHRGEIDAIIVDQVSACIPLLRLMPRTRRATILFYCHFPDKLLSSGRESLWKRLYRLPFDWIEERTTAMADAVLVNSNFTKSVYSAVFPSIRRMRKSNVSDPIVLYPPIHCENYDRPPGDLPNGDLVLLYNRDGDSSDDDDGYRVIVSINRFERKKGIHLAVQAFARLRDLMSDGDEFERMRLVVAGGYDPRIRENVEYMEELKQLVREKGLESQSLFLPSFSEADRYLLLHKSALLLYTPENEHFGIVPVEAQYCRLNIVAVNSGGPLESVIHGHTGLLAEPTPDAFAHAMHSLLSQSREKSEEMGELARERVIRVFSLQAFSRQLSDIIINHHQQRKAQ